MLNPRLISVASVEPLTDEEFKESYPFEYYLEAYKEQIGDQVKVDRKGKKSLYIFIGANEGPISHMHIFETPNPGDNNWDTGVVLQIYHNAYFDHGYNLNLFKNKKELEAVKKELEKALGNGKTVWDYALRVWNNANPKYPIPEALISAGMPEYDFTTIQTYEEWKKTNKYEIPDKKDDK